MRSPTFLPACSLGLLLVLASCLAFPPASRAGGYAVTACFDSEPGGWTEWEPSPFATAYIACPGGVLDPARPHVGDGMTVRNVVGAGHAPRGAAAALALDAPAGTAIGGLEADVRLNRNAGWEAGLQDATHGRWLWCGNGCSSSFGRWIHVDLRGLATRRVQALVRCRAVRCPRDARHAELALRAARVRIDDPSPPRLGGVRGGLANATGWLRGRQDVAFGATDNSGIRLGRVELDGRVVHDDPRACDFTRPLPCADGTTATAFDTRAWADGAHRLRLAAQDAGGNWGWLDRAIRVDNTAPPEPAPAFDGGNAWSPSATRRLRVPLPPGQSAPIVRARVRICRAGGGCQERAPQPGPPAVAPAACVGCEQHTPALAGTAAACGGCEQHTPAAGGAAAAVPVVAFAGPGEYAVRVALEDAAGNVGPYAPPLTLRFDDVRPGAPDVSAADAWRSGGALPLHTEGAPPLSGIRGYRVRIGGRDTLVAAGLPLDGLPEGGTPVEISAVSGAGLESTAVRTTLKLDRSPPSVDVSGAPDPDTWSRTAVRLELRGRDQPGLAGVRSLAWRAGAGAEVTVPGDHTVAEPAGDGRHTIAYRAVDGAGNASEPRTVSFKVDSTPPETVAFEAPDPADPRLVRVVVADRTSGVARGQIELRRAGAAWAPLPTTLEAGRLLARIDDATLPPGPYELRARAADAAGNEGVGARRVDGAPAALTLPLRRRTLLTVRRDRATLRARLTAPGHGGGGVGPRPLAGGMPLAGPMPLAGRELALSQRLRDADRWRAVCPKRTVVIASAGCTLRTDAAGRVEVRLSRGPSRRLRVSFAGDALLLPAHAGAALRTRARATLRAVPGAVRAGATVRFTGRLRGGHVPAAGKLVELQARVGPGWRTFATVRTDRRGVLRHAHRFTAFSAGRTYWFRVRVPRESGYPFERGVSRPVAVRVT